MIGVCGCITQQEAMAEKNSAAGAFVFDLIFGTHDLHQLPELIRRVRECDNPVVEVSAAGKRERRGGKPACQAGTRHQGLCYHYLRLQQLLYLLYRAICARSRSRSRTPDDIIAEVRLLAEQGCQVICCSGRMSNAYGKGLQPKADFADLLAALEEVAGLRWIRYMTCHPRDFSQKMIGTIARSQKVCEHFHLPVQSGSNAVLRRMHRGYTREVYLDLVERVRAAVPRASITTDVIVGFPGENSRGLSGRRSTW